jgi:arginyl-tRNA synthetase
MNVFHRFTEHVRTAVTTLAEAGVFPSAPDLSRIVVEPPREASHGDLATNAAMALAKDAGLKPRDLAGKIAAELGKLPEVTKTEIAGPGFINLTLDPKVWRAALADVIREGEDFGRSRIGEGKKVNVEYVSANPTGPMHVGHCRGAVFGDALANLLAAAGFAVTREYYVNDAGAQVDALARSAFLRYREALGESIGAIPEGLYPGDYLKPVGEALAKEYGDKLRGLPEAAWLAPVRSKAIAMMMAAIRDDLDALNVKHDVFTSERSLIEGVDRVGASIEWLRAKGDVYEGKLVKPNGLDDAEWEDRLQTLFKSSAFGDDDYRALQ